MLKTGKRSIGRNASKQVIVFFSACTDQYKETQYDIIIRLEFVFPFVSFSQKEKSPY